MKDVTVLKSNAVTEFTPDQLDLIKATVAKGATNDELKLFLYRCQKMDLDPLKPGQIYFVKYGSSPGTIVVGLDGFRTMAARSGVHTGTKRGLLMDNSRCVGAWCEVYRKDWAHPAREEVSLAEYNTGKAMWAKMPSTMIKKVAEAAALRMAFPTELGGLYAEEEMEQASRDASPAKADQVNQLLSEAPPQETLEEPDFATEAAAAEPTLKDYVIPIGQRYKGKKLSEVARPTLAKFIDWVEETVVVKEKPTLEFLANARAYLEETE